MTRRSFVSTLAGASLCAAPKKPNFVFILCDDLGYGDLGCYGNQTIKTPNLDKLAGQGIRFTNFYSPSPVCSPSRAGYITGRTPSRGGIYDWIPEGSPVHLKREEKTVSSLLRAAGYQTCHSGKWHLNGMFNSPEQPQPGDHGFDHWFSTQNNSLPNHKAPKNFVRNGKAVGPLEGYSSAVIVDEATSWLKARNQDAPYLLFVNFHSPHETVATGEKFVAMYPGVAKEKAQYFGNVTQMDHEVGRLLSAVGEDAVVLFASDNGPETLNRYPNAIRSHGSPGPLRGMKLHLYEGGIRVPGILRYGKSAVSDVPVGGVDMLPTFCDLAGVTVRSNLDGTSWAPMLRGGKLKRKQRLFWHYAKALGMPKIAVRSGDWKLLADESMTQFELYNLANDPGETRNVLDAEKKVAARLQSEMRAIYGSLKT